MDLQKPGVCLEGVEHARLLLRRDDDRLHGSEGPLGTIACSSCSTLLASDMSAMMNRAMRASMMTVFISGLIFRLLEVDDHRHVVAPRLAQFVPQASRTVFRFGREKRPTISTTSW